MTRSRESERAWPGALLLLAALVFSGAGFAANPCIGKRWVAGPVLALAEAKTPSGDDEGIGGTGHGGDGIGGTGHGGGEEGIGGTGIIGVIAGYGSICVNGQRIQYDSDTPTHVDGLAARAGELALGQIVTVTARPAADEHTYQAEAISVLHALAGPVEQLNIGAGTLRILGQTLRLPEEAMRSIHIGDRLLVSGNRQPDGEIVATRVARLRGGGGERITGPVGGLSENGFHIGEQEIRVPAGARPPRAGVEVQVRGRLSRGVLLADTVRVDPATAFVRPIRTLNLQGYVREASGHALNVDGIAMTWLPGVFDGEAGAPPEPGSRIQVSARMAPDGRIVAERVYPETPARPVGGGIHPSSPGDKPMQPGIEPFMVPHPDFQRPEIMRPEAIRPFLPMRDIPVHPVHPGRP